MSPITIISREGMATTSIPGKDQNLEDLGLLEEWISFRSDLEQFEVNY